MCIFQIITRNGNIRDLWSNLMVLVKTLRVEKVHVVQDMIAKVHEKYTAKPEMMPYETFLSNHGTDLVSSQMEASKHIKLPESTTDTVLYNHYGYLITVTPTSCECSTFRQVKIPCRHILALRRKRIYPLFVPEACTKR